MARMMVDGSKKSENKSEVISVIGRTLKRLSPSRYWIIDVSYVSCCQRERESVCLRTRRKFVFRKKP